MIAFELFSVVENGLEVKSEDINRDVEISIDAFVDVDTVVVVDVCNDDVMRDENEVVIDVVETGDIVDICDDDVTRDGGEMVVH